MTTILGSDNKEYRVSEVETTYKSAVKPSQMFKVKSSKDIFKLIENYIDLEDQGYIERTYVVYLNSSNGVLGIDLHSEGGTCGTLIDVKKLFQGVLTGNARSFVMWHNHPSGNMKASSADLEITRKIKNGAKLLDISFLDHLIIDSEGNYLSMADEGIM